MGIQLPRQRPVCDTKSTHAQHMLHNTMPQNKTMADEPRVEQPPHLPPQWEHARRIEYFVQAGEEPMSEWQSIWLSDRRDLDGCARNTHTILKSLKTLSRGGAGWLTISIEAPGKRHYMARPFGGVPMFLSESTRRNAHVNVTVLRALLEQEEELGRYEVRIANEIGGKKGNLYLSAFLSFNVGEQWGRNLERSEIPGHVRRKGLSMKEIEIFLFVLVHLKHSILFNQVLHGIFKYISHEGRMAAIGFIQNWIDDNEDYVNALSRYLLTNVKTSFIALAQPYVSINVEETIDNEMNRNE